MRPRSAAIARKEGAGGLVVGLPLGMDGSFGPAAQAAKDWAMALARGGRPAGGALGRAAVQRGGEPGDDRGRPDAGPSGPRAVDAAAAAYTLQAALDATRPAAAAWRIAAARARRQRLAALPGRLACPRRSPRAMSFSFPILPDGHLLAIEGLEPPHIGALLDLAESYALLNRSGKTQRDLLKGRTLINLFFEDSTRTRTSFELAGKRLGADVINMSVSTSPA